MGATLDGFGTAPRATSRIAGGELADEIDRLRREPGGSSWLEKC